MECSPDKVSNIDEQKKRMGFSCTETKPSVSQVIATSDYLSEAMPNYLGRHIIAEFF